MNSQFSTRSAMRSPGRVLNILLLLLLVLPFTKAMAVECGFTDVFTENISLPVIGSGLSTVGEDVPVGKVIYKSIHKYDIRATGYFCTVTVEDLQAGVTPINMNTYTIIEAASTPSGPATNSGGVDIFPTNIPGVGVKFNFDPPWPATTFPNVVWEREMSLGYGTLTQGLGQFAHVTVELVKTGPIQQGNQQILGSSFPTFRITSGSKSPFPEQHVFANVSFSGATVMHTKTCQLAAPNINVDLGRHDVNQFTGPGVATDWVNFDIALKDCPPFYGYGDYAFTERTGAITGSNSDNAVTIGFRSVNGVVESNPLLAKIESGPNAATGVGIELSQQNISGSIPLDGSGGFDLLNLPKQDNASYLIPLKARYVQTDNTVTAGPANGAVVFTITYQ